MTKKYLLIVILFITALSSYGCLTTRNRIEELYDKHEYYITMRDGIRLFTAVYTPKDTTVDYPILMTRTCYTVRPYGEDKFPYELGPSELLAKEKYIFVYQDVRGRFMSEGKYVDVRPYIPVKKSNSDIDESSDTYDTIDWLIKNIHHNNGKAGLWGISYPGFYAAMGCLDAHPALKAVSPQAPIADWFIGDDFHHNGALALADFFDFYSVFGVPRDTLIKVWPKGYAPDSIKDGYKFYLQLGPVKNINSNYFKNRVQFWNDVAAHPEYDEFWKARNTLQYFKNIKPAVLVTGGWFDSEDLFGSLNTYKYMKENSPGANIYVAMGPWFHGGWARSYGDSLGAVKFESNTSEYYQKNIELLFFNYYLKGKGKAPLSNAYAFETGSNRWNQLNRWLAPNISEIPIFISSNNSLSFTQPALSSNSFYEYTNDPSNPVPYTSQKEFETSREFMVEDQRFAYKRDDVLSLSSPVIDSSITIAGPITADLYVSTSGTDQDFVVKVIDVYPGNEGKMSNYQMLLRWEIMRGKFRNSYENPEPFTPGKVARVKFTLPDVLHTFKKGHRIMVQIQSSLFPMFDRNPGTFTNIYECGESAFIKTQNRIYFSKEYPSKINVGISR